ncbi:MAG TPA: hypothetical protein VFB79_01765 [Candidatus Angelobacter sp.]|nr:hypothetical protein [Candidatus Angelobacter sp.]
MLIIAALFILWILSMYFYLPLPVVVLLFAALVSGATVSIWFALMNRRHAQQHVIDRDTNF